jgi:hypothetical protein
MGANCLPKYIFYLASFSSLCLVEIFYLPLSAGNWLRAISSTFCRRLKLASFFFFATRRLIKMKWYCCFSSYLSVLSCRQKELLHFGLRIHLQGQYCIQFLFLRCEKLAYNLNFTKVYFNLENHVTHYLNLMSNPFIWIYSGGVGHDVHETF